MEQEESLVSEKELAELDRHVKMRLSELMSNSPTKIPASPITLLEHLLDFYDRTRDDKARKSLGESIISLAKKRDSTRTAEWKVTYEDRSRLNG
jgi:hypothetical protein